MKTKINDTYIDLREVAAVTPLKLGNRMEGHSGFGFGVHFKNRPDSPWFLEIGGKNIDPYAIDSAVNDAARAEIRAIYEKFIADWMAV